MTTLIIKHRNTAPRSTKVLEGHLAIRRPFNRKRPKPRRVSSSTQWCTSKAQLDFSQPELATKDSS